MLGRTALLTLWERIERSQLDRAEAALDAAAREPSPVSAVAVDNRAKTPFSPLVTSLLWAAIFLPGCSSLLFNCSVPAATGYDAVSCEALRELFNSTGGGGWGPVRWGDAPAGTSYCSLPGVTCDHGGAVLAVSLPFNNLVGELSDSLFALSSLTSLVLAGNFLLGTLPQSGYSGNLQTLCVAAVFAR